MANYGAKFDGVTDDTASLFPVFATVYLSGNPVTAVDLSGAGIGAATRFTLAPGQAVTLTYSAGTPTWRWFATA